MRLVVVAVQPATPQPQRQPVAESDRDGRDVHQHVDKVDGHDRCYVGALAFGHDREQRDRTEREIAAHRTREVHRVDRPTYRQQIEHEQAVETGDDAHEQQCGAPDPEQVRSQSEHPRIGDEVVHCKRRPPADTPQLVETLRVNPEQPVVPTHALREPAAHRARPLGAHHQATVIVDALPIAQQDHGILEILGIYRQ